MDTSDPCVAKHEDQFEPLSPGEQPKNSSRSISVVSCLSIVSPSIKLLTTLTEIEMIDPRILHSAETMDQIRMTDKISLQSKLRCLQVMENS